jgi:F-type H+-transporting ATPase subunit a
MLSGRLKPLLVAAFSVFFLSISLAGLAQPHEPHDNEPDGHTPALEEPGAAHGEVELDPATVILEHVMDGHEFHFFTWGDFHATIPLPVILYSPQRGFDMFMSSKFHHGEHAYKGYRIAEGENIVGVREDGSVDDTVKVYDFSMTRNVIQMIIALVLLVWIMRTVAKRYEKGEGVLTAPTGLQNLIEPVITFVRDEVAKPNLAHKHLKYLPYLLTVFFFILINNLFGLLPGLANVTGNVAFTLVLGVISFIVILFSSNKHYWGHILWPPGVPLPIKFILIPVELMGVFTKPFALIVRLFANMVAGHIIILSFVCLIFIFGAMNEALGLGTSPFFVALAVFIYLIEVLVAFIQAFIFTNLTAVFIGQAFEGSHDDVDGHTDAVII